MHMADALISPVVGGGFWAACAGLVGLSSRRLRLDFSERRIPLMGVAGAFVFAAQMINFAIPGTGSSGHIGGGLLLAILLGPWAGFLVMASILVIQALFFADGGLLALGCNVFNLGFWTCFAAYPLIYKPLAGSNPARRSLLVASILAAVVGLQLGSLSVVLQTVLSGRSELPFGPFLLAMQPIHLAIGIVEGVITAAVVLFVRQVRPELLTTPMESPHARTGPVIAGLAVAALLTAGVLSWFASAHPDGLEWSVARTAGSEELAAPETGLHSRLAEVQEKTALLPDYTAAEIEDSRVSTSFAGLVGGLITCLVVVAIGLLLKFNLRPPAPHGA
jgi:cobalt/nickel transport system permease protein